jgi:hypothetical protein
MMTFRHITHFRPGPRRAKIRLRVPSWVKANTLVGAIGIFVGLYVYSSAALAEVEDDVNQDDGNSVYRISSLSRGVNANFSIDSVTNIDSQLEFSSPKDPSRFDEAVIPEAVWSLDASIGDPPDRISGGLGSETHIISGSGLESIGSWKNKAAASFSSYERPYSLLLPPPFQVASCGGSSAEHSDLAYCSARHKNSRYRVNGTNSLQGNDPSTSTTPDTDNSIISPDSDSSSSAATQSNLGPLTPPIANTPLWQGVFSPLTSPFPSAPLRQGDLTLQDQCNTAPCLTVQVDTDPPTMQLSSTGTAPALLTVIVPPPDSPTPPIDGLAPSIDSSPPEYTSPPISVDVPGPVSDVPPVFTPPAQKPIPEASTWTMTVIGFSIVVCIFGTKRKNRRQSDLYCRYI